MAAYEVKIPDWSEGKPLTITGIKADSVDGALAAAVAWVNAYAGRHYCDRMPAGTKVYGPGGLLRTVGTDESDVPVIVAPKEG